MEYPENILIIRNDRLGDFMLAYPTFNVVRKLFPKSTIHALVPEYTAPMAEIRILVVEDDAAVRRGVADAFTAAGYLVIEAADGPRGLEKALSAEPELVLLDVGLPEMDGITVLGHLRRQRPGLPVILLTAFGAEADRVRGLRTGADDYVVKPFSIVELIARVEAVLRRAQGSADTPDTYEFGNISIDFRKTRAFKDGECLLLSPREFKLLRFMIDHRGEVLARERLLDAVWGYDNVPFTRTVDMHIAKLRKKIEDRPQDPTVIVTVHRVGYRFNG